MGSAIKVRVDPSRAAEAREVINEWELVQPPAEPAIPPPRSRVTSLLCFGLGMVTGGAIVLIALRNPISG